MKIHINKNYIARQKTGKGKFAARLVKALKELGVEVNHDPKKKSDIALHIGRYNYEARAKRHVLRVGPANIDTNMNWKKINHEKAKSVKKADAIVYQSQYSKKIYHKLVCKPDKPETVIFNGADWKDYVKLIWKFRSKPGNYSHVFLASTRVWLKQKRLKQIVKAFLDGGFSDDLLIVCGDTTEIGKKYKDCNNIYFAGKCDDELLATYYHISTAMIHLTHIDACPNSVVEAQVAGCPVICTDQGGTHEILRYGKVLKDKPFKYRPIDLNKPPKVDREELIKAMHEALNWNFDRSLAEDLYIENIAKKYLDFFKEVL